MRKTASLPVQVPSTADDKPSWLGVGVVAVVGFALGVAWPRAAGIRLAPHAPGAPSQTQVEPAAAPPSTADVSAPRGAAPAAVTSAAAPSASVAHEGPGEAASTAPHSSGAIKAIKASLLSCRTLAGESLKGKECGASLGLDAFARTRLERLERCPALAGKSGKLSVVLTADYGASSVLAEIGKSTSIGDAAAIAQCVRGVFQGTRLDGVKHQNAREVVAYALQWEGGAALPSGARAADAPSAAQPSTAAATAPVTWEVALVRDAPKTGSVIARLPRGTQVEIGQAEGGWYRVTSGSVTGWVYRGALGR